MTQVHRITVAGKTFDCPAQTTVLLAMKKAMANVLPVGCCGGGCGICKVRVLSGDYQTKVMSKAHISPADENEHIALACRILPETDLVLEPFNKAK